ncbi:MAG: hypothetical protein HY791_27225 [Deltaproteobacteria bacterium]|nr:hypothetical protein [Deltaproteobacteria bacterium]
MSFKFLGFPIRVQPIFFVVAVLLNISSISEPHLLLAWVAIVFVSVLLHEVGHALAFRRFGQWATIELHAMGGHTVGTGRYLSNRQDAIVSFSGPLVGLSIGGLTYLASQFVPALTATPVLAALAWDIVWVNLGWGLLNLLPIVPMDGGRILVAGLRHIVPARATELSLLISAIVAVLAAIAAYVYHLPIAALFAALFAYDNFTKYKDLR